MFRGAKANKTKKELTDTAYTVVPNFGATLFAEVCSNTLSGNVLISPLSVYKALALVNDGATPGSDNKAEMEQVLGPPFSVQETEGEDTDDADVQLTVATSLWADELKQLFVDKAIYLIIWQKLCHFRHVIPPLMTG